MNTPETPPKKNWLQEAGLLVKDLFVFVVVYLVFTSAGWGMNYIPSSSMEPTLEVGDRIAVSKFAYGYNGFSIPFSKMLMRDERLFSDSPKRGDVAVFKDPKQDYLDLVKRVVGMPGEKIETRRGRLYINDTLVERQFVRNVRYTDYNGIPQRVTEYIEILPGNVSHRIYEHTDAGSFDDMGPFIVPEGHYFMMGDNRDNSLDSRNPGGIGYIPLNNFVGRVETTTFSLYDCDQGKEIECVAGVPVERFFNSIE